MISVIIYLSTVAANTTEYETLVRAQECSKDILNEVNRSVQECENQQRLVELQRRLDKRPIENSSHPIIVEYKVRARRSRLFLFAVVRNWRAPIVATRCGVETNVTPVTRFVALSVAA
jgi:hypothetical protein